MAKRIFIVLSVLLFFSNCSNDPSLTWNESESYRWAELKTGYFGEHGFEKIDNEKANIDFSNDLSESKIAENRHYLNGSGVAVADIDNDGLIDIYFAKLDGSNKLYKNLGNYHFQDITEDAGLTLAGHHSTGATFADVTGNGFPDLIVTSLTEKNSLYINDGYGKFTLKQDSGFGESKGSNTIALADINGDGFLDVYISNYKPLSVKNLYSSEELELENTVQMIDGKLQVIPPFDQHYQLFDNDGQPIRVELGSRDELFINNGDGTFEIVNHLETFLDPNGNPIGLQQDWGLTATFRDITGNRLPDIYVANDFWTPDRMWINQGDGTFKLAENDMITNLSYSSMGVDFSDINRDGNIDFMVSEMLSQIHSRRLKQTSQNLIDEYGRPLNNRNSVYLNRGDQTFAQIAHLSGLEASEWSWATHFLDIDLDGYEDLIIANGYAFDYIDMDTQFMINDQLSSGLLVGKDDILQYPSLKLENRIFKNNGDLSFTDVSKKWGFDEKDISMGVALADLNNSGVHDLIINRFNDSALIYRNKSNSPRIAVRLKGLAPNTDGIGAKIELTGGPVVQQKEMVAGGNYVSGSQYQVMFAADKSNKNHKITVTWRNGKRSVIENVEANRIYELNEAFSEEPGEEKSDSEHLELEMFRDISERISHTHEENKFDDIQVQELLPLKLSQLGPGIAWVDFNRNGYDDLIIGASKGGIMGMYNNHGDGSFTKFESDILLEPVPGDQSTILSWTEDDYLMLVTGSVNYEQGLFDVPSAYLYSISPTGSIQKINIPWSLSATGAMAAADISGDGRVDLFTGGRFVPGNYPENASSRIYLNEEDAYSLDQQNAGILDEIGLITGAVFSDFDQDGTQDLIISTEWGEIKLLKNNHGLFEDVTSHFGLDEYKGWWRGVVTGDFTNNGYPDIIVANIGLNSAYQIDNDRELRMYYDDINWNGRSNIIDSYFNEDFNAYVPRRRLHDFGSIPTILQRVKNHTEFAQSSIDNIFDTDFNQVPYKSINTLEHMIFINNGSRFEAMPLPIDAQFSAGFDVSVADFNNDGFEDIFMSMNDFSFPDFVPRLDAGRGLILLGIGDGNFTPVNGSKSGIKIYGEQRGAAVNDFNNDGRADIAVTQNNGQTKLYQNTTERKGVFIQLIGTDLNSDAIGSSIRLVYQDGTKGPRREIQAGSGYLSQNSKTQILGMKETPVRIEVIWSDGDVQMVPFEENKLHYSIKKN